MDSGKFMMQEMQLFRADRNRPKKRGKVIARGGFQGFIDRQVNGCPCKAEFLDEGTKGEDES
jgi:hypothetical protein